MPSSRWCIGYDRAANDARPRRINARRPAIRRSSSSLHDVLAELFEIGHYGRVLRCVLLRDALRNLSLSPRQDVVR
jgi:hypothetical protein